MGIDQMGINHLNDVVPNVTHGELYIVNVATSVASFSLVLSTV